MKTFKFALFRQNFLLCCFASAGNRTRVYRVAGDNSTTEPPMLDLHYFNRFNKVLLFNPIFSSKLWIKSWKLCFSLIEVLSSAEYFDSFLFFDSETVKNENVQVCAFPAKFFALLLCIGRESKPGLSRGRRQFYHWTTDAWFKML